MTDKKRGGKTKYSLPQHWRSTAAALLVLFALIGGSCARYVLFVSQTVYQERPRICPSLCINPTIC